MPAPGTTMTHTPLSVGYVSPTPGKMKHIMVVGGHRKACNTSVLREDSKEVGEKGNISPWGRVSPAHQGKGRTSQRESSPTLTDSGLVTMTEVLWKTLTLTTGPYFLALGIKVTVNSPCQNTIIPGPEGPHCQGEQKHPISRNTQP